MRAVVGLLLLSGGCAQSSDVVASSPLPWTPRFDVDVIEVNQAVGVEVFSDGAQVPEADRLAPLIAGRDATVRVAWTVHDDFVPHELRAVLILQNDDEEPIQLISERRIVGDADRDLLDGTLNFVVEGASITGSTTLRLALLDRQARIPPVGPAQIPAEGEVALHAWDEPMDLRVNIRPCATVCGQDPPVIDDDQRARTEAMLWNVFPIRDLHLTWIDEPLVLSDCDQYGLLDEMAEVRDAEGSPDGEYTHCVFGPSYAPAQFDYYGYSHILSDDPAEDRVSYSVSWATRQAPDDADTRLVNVAHELGHAHGRSHTWVDGGYAPQKGSEYGCRKTWGLGIRPGHPQSYWEPDLESPDAVVMPPAEDKAAVSCLPAEEGGPPSHASDLMSYTTAMWISAYTYSALAERVRTVSAWGARRAAPTGRTLSTRFTEDGLDVRVARGRLGASDPVGADHARVPLAGGAVEVVPVRPRLGPDGEVVGFTVPLPDAAVEGPVEVLFQGRHHRLHPDSLGDLP